MTKPADRSRPTATGDTSPKSSTSLAALNEAPKCEFMKVLGDVVEHSPWVVTMAGEVVDTYEGSGDLNTCSRYGAVAGGLKGY